MRWNKKALSQLAEPITTTFLCLPRPMIMRVLRASANTNGCSLLFLNIYSANLNHTPLQFMTHSSWILSLIISIHVTLLRAAFSTEFSISQVFWIKPFMTFEDWNNKKLARSVLPARFCSFAFASSYFEFSSWFSTRNSLTSKFVSRFDLFAAKSEFIFSSLFFYFCRIFLTVLF